MKDEIQPNPDEKYYTCGRIERRIRTNPQLQQITPQLAKLFDEAIRPYRVTAKMHGDFVAITGSREAVEIISTVNDQLIAPSSAPDLIEIKARIADTIRHKLNHEFSFRLAGLLHPLIPANMAQVAYMNLLMNGPRPITFGLGSTGTGKTHLAICLALTMLHTEKCKHIVITRPHTLREGQVMTPEIRWETAMDDQFTPVTDIICDLTSADHLANWRHNRQVELVPAGLLQGRTFNDSLIIIDEAQNFDIPTMRTAVTRLGQNSRIIVTGDPSQTQLRTNEPSGLPHILNLMKGSELASVFQFNRDQIFRHPAVAQIEALYEAAA